MENMENKIIVAFQDNHKDLVKARRYDDYEEALYCRGYEQAMSFVLNLLGIKYDEALNKKMPKVKADKRVKQINNLVIKYSELYKYSVWTPDGECREDGMTLEEAEEYCRSNKDYLKR